MQRTIMCVPRAAQGWLNGWGIRAKHCYPREISQCGVSPLTACHSDSAWRAEQPKDGFSMRCAEGYMWSPPACHRPVWFCLFASSVHTSDAGFSWVAKVSLWSWSFRCSLEKWQCLNQKGKIWSWENKKQWKSVDVHRQFWSPHFVLLKKNCHVESVSWHRDVLCEVLPKQAWGIMLIMIGD